MSRNLNVQERGKTHEEGEVHCWIWEDGRGAPEDGRGGEVVEVGKGFEGESRGGFRV